MADQQQPPGPNLVQCEITKQWVPADEIIEIQGRKVCAAGKEILLQRLKSGEALPGEMERPSVLRRFGCIFLDGLVLAVPWWGLSFAALALIGFGSGLRAGRAGFAILFGIVAVIQVVITIVYFGTLHGLRGQSLGKMAGKLKVVNLDGTPISMSKAYVRAAWYSGPSILTPFPIIFGVAMASGIVTLLVYVYFIVSAVMALLDRDKQRALHDRLAGTRVIRLG